ncbi:MAG: hypothetical protein ACE5FS_04465 [Paracoccaceae bacterium]
MTMLANKMLKPESFLAGLFLSRRDRDAVEDYGRKLEQTVQRLELKDRMKCEGLGLA